MVMLRTERLTLRPFCLEDALTAHKLFGTDEDMYRYSGWNPYATVEDAERFIRTTLENAAPHARCFAIEYAGELVGNIGAYNYEEANNRIEVGCSIAKDSWNKGFATEALKAVLQFLTESENVSAVVAWSAEENIGSRRALEKAGMVLERVEKNGLTVGNKTYNKLNYVYRG